jgi:gamma-glutamyltranspeptidase/glutathione hydrolase
MAAPLGVVAAGSAAAAAGAAEMLRAGGTAFDAVLAAGCCAAVAEPCLTSLAGGGFLLARTAAGEAIVFDFFVDAPGLAADPGAPPLEFVDAPVRFGHTTQLFHVGAASVAVPGVLAGYLHVHERLGRLPLATIVRPAAQLARAGLVVDRSFAQLVELLEPIWSSGDEGRALYRIDGRPLREGDRFQNPALGELLEAVGRGERRSFTAAELGGNVTDADVAHAQVVERPPLRVPFRDAELLTNPPPSFGGTLIALGLRHLAEHTPAAGPDDPDHAFALVEALVAMAEHRHRLGAGSTQGTTHISVADAEGNLASMTTSNGAGSGLFAPGTGVQLNNMMGEAELQPAGFGSLSPGERVPSMMSPGVLLRPGQPPVVLGTGGSARIRSAIVELVANLVDHRRPLDDAVRRPRLHWDESTLQVEPGLAPNVLAALRQRWPVNEWSALDLYFGGAHCVAPPAAAVGDPRRNGTGLVVSG